MKVFQCANNTCPGGIPMVFPQNSLSVQDILSMQEANLLASNLLTANPTAIPCNSSCYGCPFIAQNTSSGFSQPTVSTCAPGNSSAAQSAVSGIFPLTDSAANCPPAAANPATAQQTSSPGIFPLTNSNKNCPPTNSTTTTQTTSIVPCGGTSSNNVSCRSTSQASSTSSGIFPLHDSPNNCPPEDPAAATTFAAPVSPSTAAFAAKPSEFMQYRIKSLASNDQPISFLPDISRGKSILCDECSLSLTPGAVYLISYHLNAQPQDGSFVQLSVQINSEIHPEFSCEQSLIPVHEEMSHAALSHLFLLDTTEHTSPARLDFLLHTDSTAPVPVQGNIVTYRL